MAISKIKSWAMVSGTSKLQALDTAVMLISSMFWSWFSLTALFPIVLSRDSAAELIVPMYRIVAFAFGAGVLVYASLDKTRALRLLDNRKWEISLVLLASAGNIAAAVASFVSPTVLALLAAAVEGLTFPYFMLEWSRMYARHGARTAAPLAAGAMFFAMVEDVIVLAISSPVRELFLAALPIIIMLLLRAIQVLSVGQTEDGKNPTEKLAFGAAEILTKMSGEERSAEDEDARTRSRRPFIAFVAALAVFGFAGAISQFGDSNVYSGAVPYLAGGLIASAIAFLVAAFRLSGITLYTKCVVLSGIAGFLFMQTLLLFPMGVGISQGMEAFCFVGTVISVWAVCCHLAFENGTECIVFSAPAFAVLVLGLAIGAMALYASSAAPAFDLGASAAELLAFALVVALLFLFVDGSFVWRDIEYRLDKEEREYRTARSAVKRHWESASKALAHRYDLTERETEVVEFLLMGYSRARIAEEMVLSINTVNSHVQHVYSKLGIHSHQELLDHILSEAG